MPERSGHSYDRKCQITILSDYVEVVRNECDRLEAKLLNEHIHQVSARGLHGSALDELRDRTQREYATLLRKELQPTLEYFELINKELMEEIPLKEEDDPNFDYPEGYDWREGDYMWLLFKIQQHFAHREVWTGVFRFINCTQPLCRDDYEKALVELTETWQELFDKSIRVKWMARRALEATGRDEGVQPGRGYEEQPPEDTLIPPTKPARKEPRGMREKKGAGGPALPKRKGSSPGTSPNEKSQAEAHQSPVEAVRRITSSCSSLESSAKSDKGGMAGGEWDPTYDGFALDERGSRTMTSPSEGRGIRGPQNNQDTEDRGEMPKGRPLPTLREVYQMHLKRALEEEMAEMPCDICGGQDHDYCHCQAGALLESQMPGTPQLGQNDNRGNLNQGPCGWCEKKGHIALECPANCNSQSMKERFLKMKKKRKSKILKYTCRRCGEQHPFNWYCPYAIEPPIVPGECRSCATLTNHHDEECELVAIKDRIGLCAFCGDISHLYTDCPDRYPNRGPKRILPRKEGPDCTISPSIGRDPPTPPPYYGVCSFCGLAGHRHELCPKLKEAVREQAEQIAQIQMARYEEARNRAQEPSSWTKKMIKYIQDKAKIAKEDHPDRTHLPDKKRRM